MDRGRAAVVRPPVPGQDTWLMPTDGALAEALVSWIGAWPTLAYLLALRRQPAPTSLEQRLMLMLACFTVLLMVRGFWWLDLGDLFGVLTFVPATVLPLAVFLYTEGLLRRHLARWAKLVVLLGSGTFALLNLAGQLHRHREAIVAFGVFIVTVQTVLLGRLFFRDRSDLSAVENRLVDGTAIAIALVVPFLLTDLLRDLGAPVARVGTVGVLVLIFALMRFGEKRGRRTAVLKETLGALLLGLGAAGVHLAVVPATDMSSLARSFALMATIVLLLLIRQRLQASALRERGATLMRVLAKADTRSLADFLRVLDHLPLFAGYRLLRGDDLAVYEWQRVPKVFGPAGRRVVGLSRLRTRARRGTERALFHAEQLIDLMEQDRMTHACLIRERPPILLCVRVPQAGEERVALTVLRLVRRVAELITRTAVGDRRPGHEGEGDDRAS